MASGAVRACCFIGYKKPTRGELRERSTQEQLPTSFFFASSCSMSRSMCAASRGGAGERVGRVLRSVSNTGQTCSGPSGTGPAFDFSEYCLKPPHHCRGAEVLKSICEGVRALPARSAGLVTVNVFTYLGVRSKKATLYYIYEIQMKPTRQPLPIV